MVVAGESSVGAQTRMDRVRGQETVEGTQGVEGFGVDDATLAIQATRVRPSWVGPAAPTPTADGTEAPPVPALTHAVLAAHLALHVDPRWAHAASTAWGSSSTGSSSGPPGLAPCSESSSGGSSNSGSSSGPPGLASCSDTSSNGGSEADAGARSLSPDVCGAADAEGGSAADADARSLSGAAGDGGGGTAGARMHPLTYLDDAHLRMVRLSNHSLGPGGDADSRGPAGRAHGTAGLEGRVDYVGDQDYVTAGLSGRVGRGDASYDGSGCATAGLVGRVDYEDLDYDDLDYGDQDYATDDLAERMTDTDGLVGRVGYDYLDYGDRDYATDDLAERMTDTDGLVGRVDSDYLDYGETECTSAGLAGRVDYDLGYGDQDYVTEGLAGRMGCGGARHDGPDYATAGLAERMNGTDSLVGRVDCDDLGCGDQDHVTAGLKGRMGCGGASSSGSDAAADPIGHMHGTAGLAGLP